MKTYYTMFELIKMMEEGTAPKVVYYNGEKYVNEDNRNFIFEDDYKCSMFEEIVYNNLYEDARNFVTKKLIYSEDVILTDEEKALLNAYMNLVDPLNQIDGFVKKPISASYVVVRPLVNGEYFEPNYDSLTFSKDYFKRMKTNHIYSLKDLELEEDQDVEICEPEE